MTLRKGSWALANKDWLAGLFVPSALAVHNGIDEAAVVQAWARLNACIENIDVVANVLVQLWMATCRRRRHGKGSKEHKKDSLEELHTVFWGQSCFEYRMYVTNNAKFRDVL